MSPAARTGISENFGLAFDRTYFVGQVRHYVDEEIPEETALDLYLAEERLRKFSPNPLFDESWYLTTNADVRDATAAGTCLSGFYHFVQYGWREGRPPNNGMFADSAWRSTPFDLVSEDRFDSVTYLASNSDARMFIAAFPWVKPYEFFDKYGRRLKRTVIDVPGLDPMFRKEFDAKFYKNTYLAPLGSADPPVVPFMHYFHVGSRQGYSPNARFSEDFYVAFYRDVREAVKRGEFRCGFHHYLLSGEAEGRLPRYDLGKALETAIQGVTHPSLQGRAAYLERRLAPIAVHTRAGDERTVWIFVPHLNPDIAFGGYKAFFELLLALKAISGQFAFRMEVVTTDEGKSNKEYFEWRMKGTKLQMLFSGVDVRALAEVPYLKIGWKDRFLCYSSWDALIASPLTVWTDEVRVIMLVQEYEPIFHDFSAAHALSASGYEVASYPLFNSAALAGYFRAHGHGIFKRNQDAQEGKDYAFFDHVINVLPLQTLAEMATRKDRICAVYARPEGHAARNLYEMIELALRQLCRSRRFGPMWRFIGLGCLTKLPPVDLGGGHKLEFFQKMPEEEYTTLARSIDLGISLMYSPHPGVVPFEFCSTGAVVVTNIFENRPKEFFARISSNIITCEATVISLVAAIEGALDRVEDFQARRENAYRPPSLDWSATFSEKFILSTLGQVLK